MSYTLVAFHSKLAVNMLMIKELVILVLWINIKFLVLEALNGVCESFVNLYTHLPTGYNCMLMLTEVTS